MISLSPQIFAGILIAVLKHENIGIKEVADYVKRDVDLWSQLPEERQLQIKQLTGHIGGSPTWLTAEWLVNAIRKQMPGLASLFLGDPGAAKWLVKQVASIKANVWPEEVKA
jgi:hypothetical protein